jgi:hypothetical protein
MESRKASSIIYKPVYKEAVGTANKMYLKTFSHPMYNLYKYKDFSLICPPERSFSFSFSGKELAVLF